MKKKAVSVMLAISMLAAGMMGCGKQAATDSTGAAAETSAAQASESKEAADTGASSGAVEIEFVNQKREAADTFQAVIDNFSEQNPDIKVTLNTTPDGSGVLMTRASSDTLPDILMHWPTDAQYVQFANESLLADLSGKDYTGNIVQSYIEDLKMEDGGIYCLPISLNFMGVYYNVDKFTEAGFSVPQTWDELIALCDKIVEKGEVPFLLPNKDSWTVSQLWDNIGGKDRGGYTDFYAGLDDGSQSYAADAIANDSMEKMVLLTEKYSQGDTLSLGYDQAINDFATGAAYMFIQGSWALPSIQAANPDVNVEMFPMPNGSGDMKQPVGVDCAICVSAKAAADPAKSEAVDKFMAYLFSTEAGQMYSDMDHSPSAITGVTADIPQDKLVLDLIDKAGVLDLAVPPTGFEDTKRSEIQNVFMGTSVPDFLSQLDEDWKTAREAEAQ